MVQMDRHMQPQLFFCTPGRLIFRSAGLFVGLKYVVGTFEQSKTYVKTDG